MHAHPWGTDVEAIRERRSIVGQALNETRLLPPERSFASRMPTALELYDSIIPDLEANAETEAAAARETAARDRSRAAEAKAAAMKVEAELRPLRSRSKKSLVAPPPDLVNFQPLAATLRHCKPLPKDPPSHSAAAEVQPRHDEFAAFGVNRQVSFVLVGDEQPATQQPAARPVVPCHPFTDPGALDLARRVFGEHEAPSGELPVGAVRMALAELGMSEGAAKASLLLGLYDAHRAATPSIAFREFWALVGEVARYQLGELPTQPRVRAQ